MVIRIAAAPIVALTPEQEVTVVQSAGDSRLHTRENAITWASVGWAGRSLFRVASKAAGVTSKEDFVCLVKIFDASNPELFLMGCFLSLKKDQPTGRAKRLTALFQWTNLA